MDAVRHAVCRIDGLVCEKGLFVLFRSFFYRYSLPFLLLFVVAVPLCTATEVTLIGRTEIPAEATDLSGHSEAQENGTPQNRLGGLGSGIAWLGKMNGNGNNYVMLPDRGPDDGATSYRCRFQILEIVADPSAAVPVAVRLLETHFLSAPSGQNYVGRASEFDRKDPKSSLRLDPEGIRVTSDGTFLISDEYGPSIREFDAKGKWIRDLPTPPHYQIKTLGATPAEELPPNNLSGRQNNRGWEGLGLSLDGQKVYAITQSPLIQDGALDDQNTRVGTNIRLLELDLKTHKSREFLYPLDDKSMGVNDLEIIGPNRLLAIERDSKFGDAAQTKLIYEIDLSEASDISAIEKLPTSGQPEGIRPITKRLLVDLLSPQYSLGGKSFPEKIEGIALGPKLADGSRVLIVSSDNDFKADQPTQIYAFAIFFNARH